ncbi:MAG TPA: inositol monophosphatase family protein [Actinomycetota bacterium]|nr:inositol monophosphatase family protein [Actinomycetota bacterium]
MREGPNPAELRALREVAERAVELGAWVVRARFGETPRGRLLKGAGDHVTAADHESEDAIRAFLERETPDVPVLGEESGGRAAERYWLVDPLDGTTNFLLGLPAVGVSVALVAGGRPVVGAVAGPLLGLSFSAARGQGAWSEGRRLEVSDRPVEAAVVAVAFPFRRKELFPRYRAVFDRLFGEVEDVRRVGAASLDLAWVAAGVFDGFLELSLGPWDVAAGALLVEEAGGVVSDWRGGPGYLEGDIVAGSQAVHEALLRLIREADPA